MKAIGDILESSALASRLSEGRRLLSLQRAADAACSALGLEFPCRVLRADAGSLELGVPNAAAATRLRQILPTFLSHFNRESGTAPETARLRVLG